MNKIIYDLLLKLKQCDDKHNRCDYLMEHDEITYLLEYIEMLEDRRKQNVKYEKIIDKIKGEYIDHLRKLAEIKGKNGEENGALYVAIANLLELLEEIE